MTGFISPASKLLGHLPRLAVIQQGGVPVPINCEIDLSNRCSLGCEWCHFAHTHTRGPLAGKRAKPANAVAGGDLMDIDLAFRIIDQLADAGVASITWTGGGEPTLHPSFDGIVAYAAGKLEQGIYTHGGHIDGWRAELLKQNMRFVYISLDAATKDAYRAAKGGSEYAFTAACNAIRKLSDPPIDGSEGATIGVGYLVTAGNWTEARAAVELVAELGADYIQFRPTVNYAQEQPGVLAEDTGWMEEASGYLADLQQESERFRPGFVQLDLDRFRMYQEWDGHSYSTCWWSGLQTVITPNGKVWTCVNKREHPGAELGDLSVESFAEVWGRKQLAAVDGSCRVMCRGHIANLEVDEMMADRPHAAFV